jgi:hypothetical protein
MPVQIWINGALQTVRTAGEVFNYGSQQTTENPFKRGADGKIASPSAISAMTKANPQAARAMCKAAGERVDAWFPDNPQ